MKCFEYILPLLLLVLCVSCVSDAERISNLRDKCAYYGFKHGSVAMAQCVQSEEQTYQRNLSRALNTLAVEYNRSIYPEQPKQTVCNTSGSINNAGGYSATTRCQ